MCKKKNELARFLHHKSGPPLVIIYNHMKKKLEYS